MSNISILSYIKCNLPNEKSGKRGYFSDVTTSVIVPCTQEAIGRECRKEMSLSTIAFCQLPFIYDRNCEGVGPTAKR